MMKWGNYKHYAIICIMRSHFLMLNIGILTQWLALFIFLSTYLLSEVFLNERCPCRYFLKGKVQTYWLCANSLPDNQVKCRRKKQNIFVWLHIFDKRKLLLNFCWWSLQFCNVTDNWFWKKGRRQLKRHMRWEQRNWYILVRPTETCCDFYSYTFSPQLSTSTYLCMIRSLLRFKLAEDIFLFWWIELS